jgi:chromosomal replication initiation ATPase DnaA
MRRRQPLNSRTKKMRQPSDIRAMLLGFEQLVNKEMTPPVDALTLVSLERYSVGWDEVVARPRNKPKVVMLRRMVSKVLREMGFSYNRIADLVERDHGSVMYNVRVMDGMMDIYPDVVKEYKDFKKDVSQKIFNQSGGK